MGGSPCKAWDWRNPIVQTLFTQGPTRTAVLRPRRCYAHGEIRAQTGGVVLRPQPAAARLCRPGPGGVGPGFSGFGRRYTKGRLPIPWGGRGAADRAQAGQKRQRPAGGGAAGGRSPPGRGRRPRPCSALWAERRPPEGGSKTAQAGQKRQRPAGGRRAGGARPAGAFGPGHVRPFGPNAAPPPPGTLAYRALSLAPSLVSSTP